MLQSNFRGPKCCSPLGNLMVSWWASPVWHGGTITPVTLRHIAQDLTKAPWRHCAPECAFGCVTPLMAPLVTELSKMMSELKLERYKTSKLQLKDILEIDAKNVEDVNLQTVKDLPWNFLQKLMALNVTARNTKLIAGSHDQAGSNDDEDPFSSFLSIPGTDKSGIHPLDVVCALLHCSDHFLQQEIVSKMSMCQFAVPLLLPAGDGTNCTLMLWAMRDIVKRWTPHSQDSKDFKEDNVVNVSMPTFSFVRLGKTKSSKSKILNQVLSPAHISHEFFVHRDMEGADVPRKVSDGLVEISWYFPRHDNDTFPGPVAVTNLRGDLSSNLKQLWYLSHVSSAVFMFVEKITEAEYNILADLGGTDTSFYFIISKSEKNETNTVTAKYLTQLFPVLKMDKTHVLVQSSESNDTELVRMIQGIFGRFSAISKKMISLLNMAIQAAKFEILVDEDLVECQNAKKRALKITEGIKDVMTWKKETMRLQGDTWKEISKIEKEMCRRKYQGEKESVSYKSELKEKRLNLRRKQNGHEMTDKMVTFCSAISTSSLEEKCYFMKWMKCYLDSISRKNLAELQEQYKKIIKKAALNGEKEVKPSDIALGIEHFLRELGQFYEAECAMVKEGEIKKEQKKYSKLPGIAADLLLDGFPLELIDGDSPNIPMQWITDILTELDTKTGGRCRMRVITVLGVQSTGKSTLLNTMFGLQFPVASGQCTRGAFMTLINVRENYRKELGCDFILVIDTEGLKSSALMAQDNNQEHDNELSTLVIGLSDITIINMAMENTADMKDILQIVVHAFLRMSKAGKKPNCQFAHQNVSDVSAPNNMLIERMQLMEELNKMAQKSAKMEGNRRVTAFSDIIDYSHEEHSWYIPSLWHGIPPMASINSGYSKNVCKFKQHLFEFIKKHNSHQ
uniref:VLIG-type G domain-containing protein n=1 Tax=Leptobrachium leishanense TaxID=445787 RepID=A0A8C5Q071_9ANUR